MNKQLFLDSKKYQFKDKVRLYIPFQFYSDIFLRFFELQDSHCKTFLEKNL